MKTGPALRGLFLFGGRGVETARSCRPSIPVDAAVATRFPDIRSEYEISKSVKQQAAKLSVCRTQKFAPFR